MITFVWASLVVFGCAAALHLGSAVAADGEDNDMAAVSHAILSAFFWALATWALVLLLTR